MLKCAPQSNRRIEAELKLACQIQTILAFFPARFSLETKFRQGTIISAI